MKIYPICLPTFPGMLLRLYYNIQSCSGSPILSSLMPTGRRVPRRSLHFWVSWNSHNFTLFSFLFFNYWYDWLSFNSFLFLLFVDYVNCAVLVSPLVPWSHDLPFRVVFPVRKCTLELDWVWFLTKCWYHQNCIFQETDFDSTGFWFK